MNLKVKKLALLTMPGIVAMSLMACGGGSSGSSGGDTPSSYDTTKPSLFATGGGDPVTPSGVTAPTADNAEVAGYLVVQYLDDNYSSKGSKASEYSTLNLHLWDDGCAAGINAHAEWNDTSITPTSQNEYGVIWNLPLTKEDADGCMGIIVRDKDIEKLGIGDDMKLKWTADDHTVTIGTKKKESYASIVDAFNEQYSAAGTFSTSDASAHFVAKNIIAWGSADKDKYGSKNIRLQYNKDGLVEAADGQLNGEYIDLVKMETAPADIVAKHQNLKDFNFYQISDEDLAKLDEKAMLKGEMVIVGLDGDNNVKTGSVIQTAPLIDELYADAALKETLGATVESDGVLFKVWAPTAKTMKVHIWPSDESYSSDEAADMTFNEETGVWSYKSTTAGEGSIYKFQLDVYHPGVRKMANIWATDPYTLTLTGGNSVVVDLNNTELKPEGWDDLKAPHSQATDADIAGMFITESHIRDLTVGPDKGIPAEKQGKYVGLLDTTTNVGKHLKALAEAGVTHMEFLPMYDIASINEDNVFDKKVADEFLTGSEFCSRLGLTKTEGVDVCGSSEIVYDILATTAANDSKDETKVDKFLTAHIKELDAYNWGYDPWHYAAPEGSYATDKKPTTRIKEIRQLFQAMKKDYGMNVILDVVYNHTDGAGLEKDSSVLDRLVPWYYNRLNATTGTVNADTCCADSASENKMFAKLMEDTLVTWAKDYKVDAFRFDLMGYIPKQVMIDTLKNVKERSGNNEIYFFGEGWDAGSAAAVVGSENNATQINMHGAGIGTFNDRIRDGMRGSGPFDHGDALIRLQGFASGRCTDMNDQRKADNPSYTCDATATNEADYGMHPLNWQDVIRISMAGNLRDYSLTTYTDESKTGKEIMYWAAIAGYGDNPIETINYVSKHDNQTLFDLIMYKAKSDKTMEQKAQMQGIALASVILGQSPVFDQQGSDLLRTKFFQNDSYNTGDFGNLVNYDATKGNGFIPYALVNKSKDADDWDAILKVSKYNTDVGADVKAKMIDTYKKLATIRKEHNIIHLGSADLIKENVSFLNVGSKQIPGLIVMKVVKPASVTDTANELYVVLNAAPESKSLDFATGLTALDTGALYEGKCTADSKLSVGPWSVCVFTK